MSAKINTVIFDLGGVLIDWNPRYLYRKIFDTEEEITWFLENICTAEWNDELDAGRSFEVATTALIAKHPEHAEAISAWYGRWTETISGPIVGTVEILKAVKELNKFRLYALTNWSAETFPWAQENFPFLQWFEGIVVSGVEQCRKPASEFFQILFDRYNVIPEQALFIDDNVANIAGAKALGLNTITFTSPEQLSRDLAEWRILNAESP